VLALPIAGGVWLAVKPGHSPPHVVDAAVVLPPPPPIDAAPPPPADAPLRPIVHHEPSGTFSIDSTPYATIFVDGKRLGVTPILKHALAAGHHQIRAVLEDGRDRTFGIDVPAGKQAKPENLVW
jgi:hypothetical protein